MRGPLITITVIVLVLVGVYFLFGDRPQTGEPDTQTAEHTGEPVSGQDGGNGQSQSLDQEAERYVSKLTEPDTDPVAVEKADHFISKDQVLSLLPEGVTEEITREKLETDPDLSPNTPITVVKKAEAMQKNSRSRLCTSARRQTRAGRGHTTRARST